MGGSRIADGAQSAPFERLRSKSLADEVVARLNEAILKGQLQPGEKVVEATLSRQMDVSRAPIREAIRMLVERGLLVQLERISEAVNAYDYKPLIRVIRTRDHDRAVELLTECVNGFATRLVHVIGPSESKVADAPSRGRIAG